MPWVVFFAMLGLAAAADPPRPGNAQFEKMKTLIGDWEGQTLMGDQQLKIVMAMRPISSGTALMETMRFASGIEMVTVYYPAGPSMMLTHYCCTNTQPRMHTVTAPPDLHELFYQFLDATNMMNSTETAMHNLKVTFLDTSNFRQDWYQQSRQMQPITIRYARKAAGAGPATVPATAP